MSTSHTDPSFFEVALNQRAYRDLKTDPVPEIWIRPVAQGPGRQPECRAALRRIIYEPRPGSRWPAIRPPSAETSAPVV